MSNARLIEKGLLRLTLWLSRNDMPSMKEIARIMGSALGCSSEKTFGEEEWRLAKDQALRNLQIGNHAVAKELYTNLIRMDRSSPEHYAGAATACLGLGEPDKALTLSSMSVLLSGGRIDFMLLAAECRRHIGDFNGAIEGYRLIENTQTSDTIFDPVKAQAKRLRESLTQMDTTKNSHNSFHSIDDLLSQSKVNASMRT